MKYIAFEPKEYNIHYEKCWCVFECPKCHALLDINQKEGIVKCTCGEEYKVSAVLYHVKEE